MIHRFSSCFEPSDSQNCHFRFKTFPRHDFTQPPTTPAPVLIPFHWTFQHLRFTTVHITIHSMNSFSRIYNFCYHFQNLFLSYPLQPITLDNPYPGSSTECYGLWGCQLYLHNQCPLPRYWLVIMIVNILLGRWQFSQIRQLQLCLTTRTAQRHPAYYRAFGYGSI